MRFKSPSLPELHAFLAVCQLGSFRRAADQLCVTQAAVSRAVQRLEQRLSCTLLDRSCSPVVTTLRGQEFRHLVETHVEGLEKSLELFGQQARPRKLRLSVAPTLATRWLVPRLSHFHAAHPDIDIELRQFRYDENFSRDDVDVWIEIKRPARAWPRGIRAQYLLGQEIVPACTPALAKGLRKPRDLLKMTLLQHTNYPGNWALWLREIAGLDMTPAPRPGFDLGSHLIVAACGGMGVTVIQPALIEDELKSGQLVMPFRQTAITGRGYYLCTRSSMDGNLAIHKLSAWLFEQAQVSHQQMQNLGILDPMGRAA